MVTHALMVEFAGWETIGKVFTHTETLGLSMLFGRHKPVVPQPPAALSVYCVYPTNTSMVLVCRTMEKDGNTVCLEGEALSFFRARLKEVGSKLAQWKKVQLTVR